MSGTVVKILRHPNRRLARGSNAYAGCVGRVEAWYPWGASVRVADGVPTMSFDHCQLEVLP